MAIRLENDELLQRILAWRSASYKTFSDFFDKAVESYKFVDGSGQWTDDEIAYLKSQGRAPIVINRVIAPVLLLSGLQRRTRQEPVLLPQESTDVLPTQAMNELLHWVEEKNRVSLVDSKVFLDKIITGLGYWKVWVDYDSDIEGLPRVSRISPLRIYPDPNFLVDGWEAARFVMQERWETEEDLIALFPEKSEIIRQMFHSGETGPTDSFDSQVFPATDPLAEDRFFWDKNTQRARLWECWYKERKRVSIAVVRDTAGAIIDVVTDDARLKALRDLQRDVGPDLEQLVSFIPKNVLRVRVAYVLGDVLLEDGPDPFGLDAFPFAPAIGLHFWRTPIGVVETLKDPQREKNKRRSKIIELVGRAPLSGFYNRAVGGADRQELENWASGVQVVVTYDSVKPEQILPPILPEALVRLESAADAELTQLLNLSEELSAGPNRVVSGRALEGRQRVGMVTQDIFFDTFAGEKERVALLEVGLIKKFFTSARATRILGNRVVQQGGTDFSTMPGDEVAQLISTAFDLDYDIKVAFKPAEPSVKFGLMQLMLDMIRDIGFPVPPDVLTDIFVDAGVLPAPLADRIKAAISQNQQAAATRALGGAAVSAGAQQAQPQAQPQGGLPPELLQLIQGQTGA
jgi:hypothetical protein